jgi:hypothetical protein
MMVKMTWKDSVNTIGRMRMVHQALLEEAVVDECEVESAAMVAMPEVRCEGSKQQTKQINTVRLKFHKADKSTTLQTSEFMMKQINTVRLKIHKTDNSTTLKTSECTRFTRTKLDEANHQTQFESKATPQREY